MINNSKNIIVSELPSPIFVMGCPRSGTTLVSQILDSHSRLAMYHETNYYTIFRPELHRYGDLRKSSNLMLLITNLLEAIRMDGVNPPEIEEFQKALVAPSFEGVLATLLHLYAQQQGKMRGGEKTPMHYRYLSEILEKFPESPVIFVIRDPRDTVFSMLKVFGTSIEAATQQWNEAFLSYCQASRPVHLVRYEELVQNPVKVLEAVSAFLGELYEPKMLCFFERVPEHWHSIPHKNLTMLLGPVVSASVGNFRQMSARDIEWIETDCGAGMEEMGYPFTTARKTVKRAVRKRQNLLNLLVDRLRYYGLNRERWRRGWFRWKTMLHLRVHYLLILGPLRNGK